MPKGRIQEIDLIRGAAIVLMVAFHLVYNLSAFWGYSIDYTGGFWYYEGKIAAILFILTAGISSTFSRSNLRRGGAVFAWGLLISAVTAIATPGDWVKFGILHFLGLGMIIYHFLPPWPPSYLVGLGALILALGNWFLTRTVTIGGLFRFGLVRPGFTSADYYPLLPWYGLFLLGVAIGRTVYADRCSRLPGSFRPNVLTVLGQHSLVIYLVHQPALLALLWLYHRIIA